MFSFFIRESLSRAFWRLRFDVAADEWRNEVEPMMLDRLRAEVPVASGTTRDSLQAKASHMMGGIEIEFYGGGATKYLVHGTAPHVIEPAAASALHFTPRSGDDVFAMWVNHPGTPANDFPRRAFNATKDDVVARFREAVVSTMG